VRPRTVARSGGGTSASCTLKAVATVSPSASAEPPRSLRRDASRNRERLLEAARPLFAERGLNVTMDEIARSAGVGVGTAYRRFGNRDELICALFEERMLEYVALAEDAVTQPDAWEALETFLERSVAMQAADRGLHDLLIGNARALERVARIRDRMLPLIDQLVRRAQEAGDVRPDITLTDMPLLSLMLRQVVDFSHDIAPDLWRRYLTLLLDGLRTRRAAPSPLSVPPLQPRQLDAAMSCHRPHRR
jgi:AcrR family transcriptional regulator